MLQDRARGEAQEERARAGTRPGREVGSGGGGGRGRRGAKEEAEDEVENAIKKCRNGRKNAVGKKSQDRRPKVKWTVIGRRCLVARKRECQFIIW